jgi:hypothetical protein
MVSCVREWYPGACLVGSFHGHESSDGLRLGALKMLNTCALVM